MRDQRIEQWLTGFKLQYDYVEHLSIDKIPIDAIAKEQIRLTDRFDEDTVMRYGVALQNGAEFPGIIVGTRPSTPYYLINGWHRIEAFKLADRTTIPAYIITCDDDVLIGILRRSANTLEGRPPTMAEALEHAMYMIRQGYNAADASRLMSVPPKRLQLRVQFEDVKRKMGRVGIDIDELNLPMSGVTKLSTLRERDLKAVVELAHAARLTSERIEALAREIRGAQSDGESDAIIERWRGLYSVQMARNAGGKVRDPASPVRALPHILSKVNRLTTQHRDKVAALRPEEIDSMIASCQRTIRELEDMIERLQEAKASAQHIA